MRSISFCLLLLSSACLIEDEPPFNPAQKDPPAKAPPYWTRVLPICEAFFRFEDPPNLNWKVTYTTAHQGPTTVMESMLSARSTLEHFVSMEKVQTMLLVPNAIGAADAVWRDGRLYGAIAIACQYMMDGSPVVSAPTAGEVIGKNLVFAHLDGGLTARGPASTAVTSVTMANHEQTTAVEVTLALQRFQKKHWVDITTEVFTLTNAVATHEISAEIPELERVRLEIRKPADRLDLTFGALDIRGATLSIRAAR
jgi:hypothetical protein